MKTAADWEKHFPLSFSLTEENNYGTAISREVCQIPPLYNCLVTIRLTFPRHLIFSFQFEFPKMVLMIRTRGVFSPLSYVSTSEDFFLQIITIHFSQLSCPPALS